MTATRSNVIEGWLCCPYCGKKLFPVLEETATENLPCKCRGSSCKKEFIANIEANREP